MKAIGNVLPFVSPAFALGKIANKKPPKAAAAPSPPDPAAAAGGTSGFTGKVGLG